MFARWPRRRPARRRRPRRSPPSSRGRLAAGDVVTVAGELGSGKTTFVRGACAALGVRERVTSPTYTIGHRYHGDARRDLAPRPVPVRGSLAGGVGRPRAVLRGRDRVRRVAGGGRGRAATASLRGPFAACWRRESGGDRGVLTLAFDTATGAATSALVDGDEVLGERVSRAQTLLEDVDALLRQAGAHPADLDRARGRDRPRQLHRRPDRPRGRARARALARAAGLGRLDARARSRPARPARCR